MTMEDKENLLDVLIGTHAATQESLKGIDLQMHVHSNLEWRVRDILGHCATWDKEVAKSLDAFRMGGKYTIPGFEEDVFNEGSVRDQHQLTDDQILGVWEQNHEDLKTAINELAPDQFPGDLLYPWGDERGTINSLVKYMIDHEVEHRNEILKALEESKTD